MTVRAPSADDQGAILDLVRLSLGEGKVPRGLPFWQWKHLASPFGPSYLLVAEAGGAIVGLRAFMWWTWWSGDVALAAVRAVDTATHPDWQGRGVFTRLTLAMIERVRSEGVAFVFNTPNDRSRPGYLKMGWVTVGRLSPWVRVRLLTRLPRSPRDAGGESASPSVAGLLEAPGLDALLASRRTDDVRLTTRVDRPYLRWRYAEPPGLLYHAAWMLEGGAAAAIVFRIIDRGGRIELRLCEVLTGPRDESARQARILIGEAARRARAGYVTVLTASDTIERRVVRRAGFLPLPRLGPVLTVRPLDLQAAPVDPVRRRSWCPSMGAMELF